MEMKFYILIGILVLALIQRTFQNCAIQIKQVLASPNYPNPYPGGLECLYTVSAPQGSIITLEIEDFEMEPERDFILVRDGAGPDAPVLQKLTGSKPPQFVVSTGNQLYVYIQTDQADSRRGFRIKYYEGKRLMPMARKKRNRRC